MFNKEKAGDVEVIYPDEGMREMLSNIINQNSDILKMNNKLIESLCSPIFTIKPEKE